jgi:hypothetical protein
MKASQVAISIPFDNSTNGFTASNAQAAIEEAKAAASGGSGWTVLGSTSLGSNAASTSIVDIASGYDILRITVLVTGYTGNGIFALRFGTSTGAVDSGNNYAAAHGEWNSGQNGNQSTISETTSTSMLRLAPVAVSNGRISQIIVANDSAKRKNCVIITATEQGAANTTPRRQTVADGIWANTSGVIRAVQLTTTANQLTTGSGFVVEGFNI